MAQGSSSCPVTFSVDYPDHDLDRFSTFFRLVFIIPIAIVATMLVAFAPQAFLWAGAGIGSGVLFFPVVLMVAFREKYPRWWFDWNHELLKFQHRIQAYLFLMSDQCPSTDEEQTVHIGLPYPDVSADLNRYRPLVKWLLAIPHYIALLVIGIAAIVIGVSVWFAILFTGRYPRGAFGLIEGVMRWELRVMAYSNVLVTDDCPPFRLSA
jgi:hypothetical protein